MMTQGSEVRKGEHMALLPRGAGQASVPTPSAVKALREVVLGQGPGQALDLDRGRGQVGHTPRQSVLSSG